MRIISAFAYSSLALVATIGVEEWIDDRGHLEPFPLAQAGHCRPLLRLERDGPVRPAMLQQQEKGAVLQRGQVQRLALVVAGVERDEGAARWPPPDMIISIACARVPRKTACQFMVAPSPSSASHFAAGSCQSSGLAT